MKQLTCEMCGSTDLLKQDGVFVCQSCGCKYSVEEAKRMMVEGTVDIKGTVQVDNTAFVQKYLENARRAKQKEDWDETEKYYNMVEQNDPNNIEAIFYSAYGKAKSSLVDSDIYKRKAAFKVLTNCISIIDDKYEIERREENKKVLLSIATDLSEMICSSFVFTQWKNGYGIVTKTNKGETYALFASLIYAFRESLANIAKVDDQPFVHEAALILYRVARQVDVGNWLTRTVDWIEDTRMKGWIEEESAMLEQLAKKAGDDYWKDREDERIRLEAERTDLANQLAAAEEDQNKAVSHWFSLDNELSSPKYLFKKKEKASIQAQLDAAHENMEKAKERAASLRLKLNEIDDVLAHGR